MKITNKIYKNLHLANEDDRGENLVIDFILSSAIGILIVYLVNANTLYSLILFYSTRFLYYVSFEFFLQRTPAKYQTQTKIVTINGDKPSVKSIIIRNICRFFSGISSISDNEIAIHDSLSKTFVIKGSELKKIEFKPLGILILNQSICSYWLLSFLKNNVELKTNHVFIVVLMISALLLNLIYFIKNLKQTLNKHRE